MISRFSRLDLDARAQAVLRAYQPDLLTAPGALDVEHFAEFHLGASLQYAPLSADGDVLGLTCLEDTQVQVWDEATRSIPQVRFGEAGTIFLDETAEDGSCAGRKRFTLAHECSHLILHRPLVGFVDLPGLLINSHSKHEAENRTPGERSQDWWLEWQADNMAAYLLMPTPAIKTALSEVAQRQDGRLCVDFDGIATLCDIFEVSHQAMGMRLKRIGVRLVKDLMPVA